MREPLIGNHSVRHVGEITIACMDPNARDLMERALEQWREFDAQREPKPDDPVYSFAYWLFRWSGLIDATGHAEPSVSLSAIRALVQQWREIAKEPDADDDFDDWDYEYAEAMTRCANELAALCPAPLEDR